MHTTWIEIIFFAYMFSSVSSAILICKLLCLPDPRTSGSGNPGATNILRLGGKLVATIVMIFDILKGMIPVCLSCCLGLPPFWLSLVAIATYFGHIYPVFFNFRGGKGVATALGAILPLDHHLSGVMVGTWFFTVLLSGYSSLGAIVSAFMALFYVSWFKSEFTFPIAMLSCLVILHHQNNIQRLLRGQESRIWLRQKNKR
ncbi:glycerol-3-phosphate 1-O-acyltransferase PlsY [Sodalis endosymbiont of Henestaris halophilus]|uniref:glycerol-3-phosphate 1-O-acyltransferase PlsY n=1 Tax=Sodalis endosymbiont of Henestaris halophilus TaxID=1929246 RepID=UPI000BC0DE91|nr:glycerol-3-phosphate 1-O-acyltransferase PlsY [Sodalis endosymbiont of Henestaris halophilus]SNC58601.1 putative glycerol-3-phosphate acyltransferase [Sodalis endosymbiont of Henestaris halophilus]